MKRLNESVVRRLVRSILSDYGVKGLTSDLYIKGVLADNIFDNCIEELEVELATLFSLPQINLRGCNTWDEILAKCSNYYLDQRSFLFKDCFVDGYDNGSCDPQQLLDDLFDLLETIQDDGSPTAQYISEDLSSILAKYVEQV